MSPTFRTFARIRRDVFGLTRRVQRAELDDTRDSRERSSNEIGHHFDPRYANAA